MERMSLPMPVLRIRIGFAEDVTDVRADRLTRSLLREVQRSDVGEVMLTPGAAPGGQTRAADPATVLGALTVLGVSINTLLPHLFTLLGAWVEANGQRSISVEIGDTRVEVTGRVRPEEVERYVALLRRSESESEPAPSGDAP